VVIFLSFAAKSVGTYGGLVSLLQAESAFLCLLEAAPHAVVFQWAYRSPQPVAKRPAAIICVVGTPHAKVNLIYDVLDLLLVEDEEGNYKKRFSIQASFIVYLLHRLSDRLYLEQNNKLSTRKDNFAGCSPPHL